eukprot:jgi/Tetstr1/437379/TSEL_026063.t1
MGDDDFWADEENEEQAGPGVESADGAVRGNNDSTEDNDEELEDEDGDEDEDGGDEDEGDEEDEGEGDEENVDADGSGTGKGRGPNYDASETLALLWAAIAQSEWKQIQTLGRLQKGTARRYLIKAKKVQELKLWKSRRSPEESARIRRCNPKSMWKAQAALRKDVIDQISPIWHRVTKKERSGWQTADYVTETRRQYWRMKKKLSADSSEVPPERWTTNQLEVFLFHGPPGNDEACLRPGSQPLGGNGRPQGRAAQRKKARQEAAADAEEEDPERPSKRKSGGVAASTATGGRAQDSLAPTEDDEVDKALSDISNALLGVKGSLTTQLVLIKEQAEAAKKAAAAKERLAALEAVKLQLQCFPPGTTQHTFALQSLSELTSMSMNLANNSGTSSDVPADAPPAASTPM